MEKEKARELGVEEKKEEKKVREKVVVVEVPGVGEKRG
jgi:hypothetical protein